MTARSADIDRGQFGYHPSSHTGDIPTLGSVTHVDFRHQSAKAELLDLQGGDCLGSATDGQDLKACFVKRTYDQKLDDHFAFDNEQELNP